LKVAHVNRVFDDVVRKLVCFSVDYTGFDAAPGHPERETTWVMVAAVVGRG
jgi:hypothetical protein